MIITGSGVLPLACACSRGVSQLNTTDYFKLQGHSPPSLPKQTRPTRRRSWSLTPKAVTAIPRPADFEGAKSRGSTKWKIYCRQLARLLESDLDLAVDGCKLSLRCSAAGLIRPNNTVNRSGGSNQLSPSCGWPPPGYLCSLGGTSTISRQGHDAERQFRRRTESCVPNFHW